MQARSHSSCQAQRATARSQPSCAIPNARPGPSSCSTSGSHQLSARASPCIASSLISNSPWARQHRRGLDPVQVAAADPGVASSSSADDEIQFSRAAASIVQYAFNFAMVSETYEAHSWMLLLGLLKHENCRAATILKDLGLTDLYGAWNEVLWALNASNGLEPRAFTPNVRFAERAARIIIGSQNFATWAGRDKVQSEDILMALAAGQVLSGLFPDLGLTFENVRQAAAKHGGKYKLPDDTEQDVAVLKQAEDGIF